MFLPLQHCHCVPAGWSPAVSAVAAAVGAQLPHLWAPFHTSTSSCQDHSTAVARGGEASSSTPSSDTSSSSSSPSKSRIPRHKQQTQRLQSIVQYNMPEVPTTARTGDKALLTDQQRESMALLRRFNISQPGLRGQVRATCKPTHRLAALLVKLLNMWAAPEPAMPVKEAT